MQLRLLHASEISNNYSQKLLVVTDEDKPTEEQVYHEYSLDPQNSQIVSVDCLQETSCMPETDSNTVVKIFGQLSADGQTVSGLSGSSLAEKMLDLSRQEVAVFSLDGSTSIEFQHSFLQTLLTHGMRAVLEMNQGNRQILKAINDPDPVSRYEIPQDTMDHTTQYDHQHILLMENDEAAVKAAVYLCQKHLAICSIYVLDENQQPVLVWGDPSPLTENSRLVLVGHGFRGNSGVMTLSGLNAKEVAKIIERTNRVGDKLKTVSFVACLLGSDPAFAQTVLTELEAANIKTKLHLRKANVQVRRDGTKITQGTEEPEWKHKDGTQKVVAVLDNGKVLFTKKSESHGEAVSASSSSQLKKRDKAKPLIETKKREPKIFLDQNVMKELGWDACVEVMAISWAFFLQHRPLPRKVDMSKEGSLEKKYRIMKLTKDENNVVWLKTEQEIKAVLSECDEIKSGEDVANVIKHYAETRQKKITYLMVNGWIYAVDRSSFYVFLIGKKLDNNEIKNTEKKKDIDKCIRSQIGKESYGKMRENIFSEKNCVEFVKGIFYRGPKKDMSLHTEAWCTSYLTASMISESVRNYRTFILTQMALEMTDRIDNDDREIGFKFFFENHPMANGGTWVNNKTGNEGVVSGDKLKKVLEREVNLYKSWIGNRDPKRNAEKIFSIFQANNVNNESERDSFVKSYNNYHEKVHSTEASGSLGRRDNSHTTTQDLMSASKLENSLRLKTHFSRIKASVVDQVHSHLKIQYRDNLVQMQLHEGSSRIIDREFMCKLVSKGVGLVEFRVKLTPETKFYNENMSAVHDLQADYSYFGNILWSVSKSSAFVLLVILTIRTTERDSELRNGSRREDGANRTARVRPEKEPKQQKSTKIINVVINTQDGLVVCAQIELFTPLQGFMNTYCEELNVTRNSFLFRYHDGSIKVTDTPSQLGMKNGDTIEVYQRPISG